MSIIKTLTDEYAFWDWQQQSDSYRDQFSLEGAKALFNYFDEYSEDMGESMEFDPIAWLCDFTEYKNYKEAYKDYGDGTITNPKDMKEFIDERTQTYDFEGGILVANF